MFGVGKGGCPWITKLSIYNQFYKGKKPIIEVKNNLYIQQYVNDFFFCDWF